MQIKTFRALDMREALRAIKAELGTDAVILSTKQVKKGGSVFGLFSRPMVEVIAAVDRAAPRAREDKASPSAPKSQARFSDQMLTASLIQPLREDLSEIMEEVRSLRALARRAAAEPAAVNGTLSSTDLTEGRRVGSLGVYSRPLHVEQLPKQLVLTHDWLLECGLDPELVRDMVEELQAQAPSSDIDLRKAVHQLLSRSAKTAGPLLERAGESKAVMIVGPTGVGKTTTIAKLAAHYALKHRQKVALITLDTYRVVAVEQLRAYGNILGLSVDVALTCHDLAAILELRRQADLLLIDTAGRSPLEEAALRELKKTLPSDRPVETHLVLSAATREPDMAAIAAKFAALPVQRLIFSKLDETMHYGPLLNLARRTGLPLSYLSTGQGVPDDLELATPALLADLMLEGLPEVRSGRRLRPMATCYGSDPGVPGEREGGVRGESLIKENEWIKRLP